MVVSIFFSILIFHYIAFSPKTKSKPPRQWSWSRGPRGLPGAGGVVCVFFFFCGGRALSSLEDFFSLKVFKVCVGVQ